MSILQKVFYSGIFLICSIQTHAGGESSSGGGGVLVKGSMHHVPTVVLKVRDMLLSERTGAPSLQVLAVRAQNDSRFILDPKLQAFVETFFAPSLALGTEPVTAIHEDLKNSYLDFEERCFDDDGIEVPMATKLAAKADICINLKMLSDLSAVELEFQTYGLFLHELAHHLLADQSLAVQFQTYMMNEVIVHFFFDLYGVGVGEQVYRAKTSLLLKTIDEEIQVQYQTPIALGCSYSPRARMVAVAELDIFVFGRESLSGPLQELKFTLDHLQAKTRRENIRPLLKQTSSEVENLMRQSRTSEREFCEKSMTEQTYKDEVLKTEKTYQDIKKRIVRLLSF